MVIFGLQSFQLSHAIILCLRSEADIQTRIISGPQSFYFMINFFAIEINEVAAILTDDLCQIFLTKSHFQYKKSTIDIHYEIYVSCYVAAIFLLLHSNHLDKRR